MTLKDLRDLYVGFIIKIYDSNFKELEDADKIDYYFQYDKNEIHAFV